MNAYVKFQIIFVFIFINYTFASLFSQENPISMPIAHILTASIVFFYGFNGFSFLNECFSKRTARMKALKRAKKYLKPYKKAFGDFCLINKHCSITYINDKIIFGLERGAEGSRTFQAEKSGFVSIEIDDFFNMLCLNFNNNSTFDYIFNLCEKSNFTMDGGAATNVAKIPLICVNTCPEDDLTNLPGVSVVMAKKAIKHRDETGGFQSVDEFIKFLRIKEHFAEQIRTLVVAGAVKAPKAEKKQTPVPKERIVDI